MDIVWGLTTRLEYLGCTDDSALLTHSKEGLRVKLKHLNKVAKIIDLNIGGEKSNIFCFALALYSLSVCTVTSSNRCYKHSTN